VSSLAELARHLCSTNVILIQQGNLVCACQHRARVIQITGPFIARRAHPQTNRILPKLDGRVMRITIDAACCHRAYPWNG